MPRLRELSIIAGISTSSWQIDQHVSSPYFLLNDGQGQFTVDMTRVPPSLSTRPTVSL